MLERMPDCLWAEKGRDSAGVGSRVRPALVAVLPVTMMKSTMSKTRWERAGELDAPRMRAKMAGSAC